ncbi:hypothetical protein ACFV8T_26945 [Streptomyces sp. NPDC059832]|uniref:hypothetical protein n=1 Tax=Streptomyces sp. NPDC059832 TaxID=3346966 RepID=UPI00364D7DBB
MGAVYPARPAGTVWTRSPGRRTPGLDVYCLVVHVHRQHRHVRDRREQQLLQPEQRPVDGVAEIGRDARTVAEFEGSTEEAETALVQAATTYEHSHWKVRRREIFKYSSRSYFIRIQGRLATYGFLIQLAELVHDSDAKPVVQPFA